MRVVLQRVSKASVRVDDAIVGAIAHGCLLLVGVGPQDSDTHARKLAEKIANLRIFADEQGRFDRSLLDVGGGALVVSQFTLFGDCRKGRRPDFTSAAPPEHAQPLYEAFARHLGELGVQPVATGRFGASMQVELINDGPVTLWLEN